MQDWFWARAMAAEGDLTVGRKILDTIAKETAKKGNLIQQCQRYGFDYDFLLLEEKDYLRRKVEEYA